MGLYDIRTISNNLLKCSGCNTLKSVDCFNNSKSDRNTVKKTYHCKDCISKRQKERRFTEKGFKSNLWQNLVNNAKKRNIEVHITKEYIEILYKEQKGLCAVTNLPMEFSAAKEGKNSFAVSVDRIDSSKGYTEENVRLVCARVNLLKMELEDEQLKFWCMAILNGDEK